MQWRMANRATSPLDILCRELYRLENDPDRLQMLVALRSRPAHLQLASSHFQRVLSNFHTDEYRWQAIQQIIPHVISSPQPRSSHCRFLSVDSANDHIWQSYYASRTLCSTRISFKSQRAIEKRRVGACCLNESYSLMHRIVKSSLKSNRAVDEKLRHEYRQDAHPIVGNSDEGTKMSEHRPDTEPTSTPCTTFNVIDVRFAAFDDAGKYRPICRFLLAHRECSKKPNNSFIVFSERVAPHHRLNWTAIPRIDRWPTIIMNENDCT